jgi:hypothetical protein
MEDSVVKSVDILLKDNLIRNLKKKLQQHAELDFYSASSLKQQSADRHVAPL